MSYLKKIGALFVSSALMASMLAGCGSSSDSTGGNGSQAEGGDGNYNISIVFKTIHDLRHTHVTSLLEADISVNTVAERIGHAYASTTFDIYGHVLKRAKERAAEICCDFGS